MPNPANKCKVSLTPETRAQLEAIVRKTSMGVAQVRRARVLLMADEEHPEGGYPDCEIAEEVGLCERQVVRIRQRFVKHGVQPTIARAKRSDAGTQRALDGKAEAHLITLACSTPPEGRDHWTLQLLCDELKRLEIVKSVCCETVRRSLKKTNFNPGKRSGSASPKRTGRDSSPGWRKSLTSTRRNSTTSAR
jgi:hypothetical protein